MVLDGDSRAPQPSPMPLSAYGRVPTDNRATGPALPAHSAGSGPDPSLAFPHLPTAAAPALTPVNVSSFFCRTTPFQLSSSTGSCRVSAAPGAALGSAGCQERGGSGGSGWDGDTVLAQVQPGAGPAATGGCSHTIKRGLCAPAHALYGPGKVTSPLIKGFNNIYLVGVNNGSQDAVRIN